MKGMVGNLSGVVESVRKVQTAHYGGRRQPKSKPVSSWRLGVNVLTIGWTRGFGGGTSLSEAE